MSSDLVSCKENDYLDQDPELRGQKYVCLSFVSPDDVIRQKEVHFFNKFLGSFAKDLGEFFDNMTERFKDDAPVVDMINSLKDRHSYVKDADSLADEFEHFKQENSAALEEEYLKENNFQTTVRGIKVRGVYETIQEASNRANKIKNFDKGFHVYVAEVGCWCPWSPYPDDVKDQEFSETQLNTLMKKYKEGQELKDELYRMRKNEMVQKVQMHKEAESNESGITVSLEGQDPWMERKEMPANEPIDASNTNEENVSDNKEALP